MRTFTKAAKRQRDKKIYEVIVHRCIGVLVKANNEEEAKSLAIEAVESNTYCDDWEDADTKALYQPEERDIEDIDDEDVDKIFEGTD